MDASTNAGHGTTHATHAVHAADAPSWCGRSEVLVRGEWPARWEPQEEGMKSIAASFSLS
jgi:hypothetical protein